VQDERARVEALERESKSQERQAMIMQAQARAQALEQQAGEAQGALTRERQARQDVLLQLEKVRGAAGAAGLTDARTGARGDAGAQAAVRGAAARAAGGV